MKEVNRDLRFLVRITQFLTEGITRGQSERNRQVVIVVPSRESPLNFFFFLLSPHPRCPRDDPGIKDDSNSAAQNIT